MAIDMHSSLDLFFRSELWLSSMGRKRDENCFSQSSSLPIAISIIICFFLVASCSCSPLVTKEDRKILERTDNGEISAIDVDVDDGCNRNSSYHLEFISMEPNSLFLPVFLHTDVAFYVQTGEGTVVSWIKKDDEDGSLKKTHVDVGCGDMYGIGKGSFFYIRTRSDPMRTKLRISALFINQCMPEKKKTEGSSTTFGRRHPYSNVADLLRGFDIELLGEGFNVSEVELNPIIKPSEKPPSIIPYTVVTDDNSDNSKPPLNIHKKKPDVKNRHGWTTTTTITDVGGFMVNLTQGSIVAPHWNPTASEISIVTEGEGMIQIVYPTSTTTVRLFKVKVGDVFVVPRYHPMVQISFRYSSLVLVGFTTVGGENNNLHPQFLAGTGSVFRMLDQLIVAMGFNVGSTAVGKIFSSVDDAVLLDCTYCAEEMETKMRRDADKRQKQEEEKRKEKERQKQEERRRKEEEEEEEEEEKERREKAEKRQREEEEEEERREKEQKKKEERHRKRKKQREEEEEEESRRRDEEEKVKRREEKEEERREKRQREEEEEEEEKREIDKKQKEKEERQRRRKKREEEESRRSEEEEKVKRREEKEEERQKEEEEEGSRRREEEEKVRRKKEEGWKGERW